jgi:hypothetical protein
MEYNVPNTTVLQTSQDVGLTQSASQQNCPNNPNFIAGSTSNPMDIITNASNNGSRRRAIGTGQELSSVLATPDSLGYGFWSVANFAGFAGQSNTKYVTVDGIDPLLSSGFTGVIPTAGTTELGQITLANVTNGQYPIWSLLRLVNAGSTALPAVTNLASAAQKFVTFGSTTARPDFVIAPNMTVVRSHFLPPAGTIEPTAIADGSVGNVSTILPRGMSACTAAESGGDVGGQVFTLAADSAFCTANRVTTGQINLRR